MTQTRPAGIKQCPAPVSLRRRGSVYRTRGGVTIKSQKQCAVGAGYRVAMKGEAFRLTGGFHGWLWMHLLEVAS